MPDIRSITIESSVLQARLDLRTYVPPGYDPARRYPVIYTLIGDLFLDRVGLPEWLDEQISTGELPPCLLVALPVSEIEGWWVPGTEGCERYQRFLLEEAMPAVEQAWPVSGDRANRLLAGFSSGNMVLFQIALAHPDRFGRYAALTPGWLEYLADGTINPVSSVHQAVDAVAHATGPLPDFWFVWGDADEPWESRSRLNGAAVMAALRAKNARVAEERVPGGHGLGPMRLQCPPAMRFLLQP